MPEATASGTERDKAESAGIGDLIAGTRDTLAETPAALGQAASKGADATTATMQQVREKLDDVTQRLSNAPLSTRLVWRIGRWVGRAEGVAWLASKGIGIWWSRTTKRLSGQSGNQWARTAIQWGPCVVACAWMGVQLVNRARRSAAS